MMSDKAEKTEDVLATDGAAKTGTGNKGPVLSRMALEKRVQAATGVKMGDVRNIVRATLDAMGTSLRSGERLNLPPFGTARALAKASEKPGVTRIILREVKEKERPAAAERPAADRKAAKGKKQALAAKGEAE
jgi:hypothetical protein